MITHKVLTNNFKDSRRCWIGVTAFCAAIALALTCAIEAAQAQNGNLLWAKRAGGSGNDQGLSVAADSQGNKYVTGFFNGTATFGLGEANSTVLTSAGNSDIFIAKFNGDGTLAWAKRAGGTGDDQGNGVAADSQGNSYVTGFFNGTATFGLGEANSTVLTSAGLSDFFMAKFNSDGTLAWAKRAGGTNLDEGKGVAADSLGSSYVTGFFSETVTFGIGEANQTVLTSAGASDIFVAKFNSDGSLAWAKRAGAHNLDQGNGVAADSQGNSYVTGYFSETVTFGLGEANQTVLTSAGGGGNLDIFIAKFNSNGSLVWAKRAGGTDPDQGNGVAVDSLGNSYVTGFFQGTATFGPGEANQTLLTSAVFTNVIFVAKFNSNGSLAWAKRVGGSSNGLLTGIAVDSQANSYVTAGFSGTETFGVGEANQTLLTSAGFLDMFVAKFNSAGSLAWAKRAGGTGFEQGNGITVDSQANIYVTGYFSVTATFGLGEANSTLLTSAGSFDIFIAKFAGGPMLVSCPTDSLQAALSIAVPGQTVIVSGTCGENLLVRNERQRITIDGAGAGAGTRATVNGNSSSPAFNVRGKGILIQNLIITGGNHGVVVNRGSNAVLNNNIIQSTGGDGVKVEQLSFAVLTNNVIENNPSDGVSIEDNSTVRIGFNADSDTVTSPNTIQNNGGRGIKVSNGAHARIIGNTISGNGDEGIKVERDSSADIASNVINGNQADGIKVESNSFVLLGEDSGSSIYETPNSTSVNNGEAGIRCEEGAVVDGRTGTLNGNLGATDIRSSCVNSLI